MKTSSGRVVRQSISYEITEKYRTESVSVRLKYRLKLTYPVVASSCMLARCHDLGHDSAQRIALPNDVTSKIECGQLHSELFGRRHSTLQSHGLFALAKRLCNAVFGMFAAGVALRHSAHCYALLHLRHHWHAGLYEASPGF